MTGQQNDRDELRRKIAVNYGLPVAVDAAILTRVLDQLDQAEARIKAVRDVLDAEEARPRPIGGGGDRRTTVRIADVRRALEGVRLRLHCRPRGWALLPGTKNNLEQRSYLDDGTRPERTLRLYSPDMETLSEEEVLTIRSRLASGTFGGVDFGAPKPLKPNALSSAVERQNAGMGSYRKYTTVTSLAATLFYGIVHNHPFENGNKRTALVSMLVLLQRNKTLLVGASQDDLYEMATGVAAHTFTTHPKSSRNSDSEVAGVARWLTKRTRPLVRGDRNMKFKDMKVQLESQGCEFGSPSGNYIKVYREAPKGRLSFKMGYPKANFDVPVATIKSARSALHLDETHGIDSDAFYDESVDHVVDHFVNTYRQVLDRLALT